MNNWPKQDQASMNRYYGNPDRDRNGQPDRDWVAANIVQLVPPYQLYYPKENGRTIIKRATKFKSLSVHKKCKDSLETCLKEIAKQFSPEEIIKYELDICGGTFVFRLKRGGSSLSIHSWGTAIDISHLINWFGRKYNEKAGMMPSKAVAIFKAEGWTWGGRWSTADGMHFQAAYL